MTTSPLGLGRVMQMAVPITDQEQAKSFYVELLGFELVSERILPEGQHWLEVALPHDDTSLVLADWFDSMNPGGTKAIVVSCDDVSAAAQRLQGKVPLSQVRRDIPGRAFVFVDDPDGNQVVLMQDLDVARSATRTSR